VQQRALDRHDAHPEHPGGLARREPGRIAEEEHGALARRQQLQRRDERRSAHRHPL
jgi:hypothetical protein